MSDQPFDQPTSRGESNADEPIHRLDRSFNRRTFREMVKMQMEDAPLRWSQRRDLVKFARKLGIDAFEAKLLIRAVEYELGLVPPAAMDDRRTDVDLKLVAAGDDSIRNNTLPLAGPFAVMAALLLTWLITSLF